MSKAHPPAGRILIGYFAFFPVGFAFMFLGLIRHTDASIISGALLGMYIGLLCPQIWMHLAAYPNQIYKVEWLFIAIALSPIPLWLYTMFFVQISDNHPVLLMLPVLTLFLAAQLPSPKCPQERVPIWHKRG
jgi:hypothetical protein